MKKFVVGLLVFVVGAGVGWYMLSSRGTEVEQASTPSETVQEMPVVGTTGVEEMVVSTDSGTMEKTTVT